MLMRKYLGLCTLVSVLLVGCNARSGADSDSVKKVAEWVPVLRYTSHDMFQSVRSGKPAEVQCTTHMPSAFITWTRIDMPTDPKALDASTFCVAATGPKTTFMEDGSQMKKNRSGFYVLSRAGTYTLRVMTGERFVVEVHETTIKGQAPEKEPLDPQFTDADKKASDDDNALLAMDPTEKARQRKAWVDAYEVNHQRILERTRHRQAAGL